MLAQSPIPDKFEKRLEKYNINQENFIKITTILNSIKTKKSNLLTEEINSQDTARKTINFYSNDLPNLCEEIKNQLGDSNFIKLYQYIGTNIRRHGSTFGTENTSNKSFTLANEINEAIKSIRNSCKTLHKNTLIVIDAVRNPLEALFFQERYSSFYLVAVTSAEEERKERLRRKGLTDKDISLIDKQEYPAKNLSTASAFSVQDIESCLQRADIYINNPDENNEVCKFKSLASQIIKFIALMRRPGIITPTPIERCMQIAYTAKLNSGCISRQVGAVVTDKNFSLRSIGWNDAPNGHVPCNLRNRFDLINGFDVNAYSIFEKNNKDFINHIRLGNSKYDEIKSSKNISYCFKTEFNKLKGEKNQVHTRSLHAEENAFLQISKNGGEGINGGFLFTTASPCELCSKKAVQLGITKIFYIDPYPGIAVSHILQSSLSNPELILFSGAIGRAFHRLYMPITAYKDELQALITKDDDITA